MHEEPGPRVGASAAAVFVLSAAVIALELALMRCLAIARWHNFAYLVISTALLGFGASGTLLTLVGERFLKRFSSACAVLAVLFAVSVTLLFRAAEALPLDARYVLYSGRQAALMFLYHLLLLVPFLLAATAIGLSLMRFKGRAHMVYGANLAGSGAGAALAVGLMWAMPPVQILQAVSALGLLAAVIWSVGPGPAPVRVRKALVALVVLAAACLAAAGLLRPLTLRMDQYKMLSVLGRWERNGLARRVLTRYSPRGRLDVYESPLLHQTMFAGLTVPASVGGPPPQLAILSDGDLTATVFNIRSPAQAAILDYTPMSVPYRLLRERRPRVLLLGEAGGTGVWLARRMGASHITVVQADPQVVALMRGPLAGLGGSVLTGPDVTVAVADPRAFVERTEERFDLIHVVTAEGMAAATSGLRSLSEDFLLTREGMAACITHLTGGGVVALTRGVQQPPRDNVKILATLSAALESLGVREQGPQIVQVRNYLAATTLAFARGVVADECAALSAAAGDLGLDVEWAPCPGVRYDAQLNQVEGPAGKPYSYFHYAALQMLSKGRARFFDEWAYNVRPATDDSPYFHDFFRWKSLPLLIHAYGKEWLRRSELGYAVLVFALAEVTLVGVTLILLPLLWVRRRGSGSPRGSGILAAGAYFVCLGLGYLMLEIVCLLRFTYFLGDPVYAAAGVISSFLVFSGLGSATSARLFRSRQRAICAAAAGAAALAVLYAVGLGTVFDAFVGWPLAARFAVSVALTAPLAFLMGWPFPNGLALLEQGRPALVPWAWGANGFASVAASPLAVMIAVGAGFRAVLLVSAGLYLLAVLVSFRLARTDEG